MADVRMPTQKRGIEKRNKIIEAGFKIICEKGYYNITTNDIAKEAEVSVGIIYQYFNDKKEIFLEGAKQYSNDIMFPIFSLIDEHQKLPTDLKSFFQKIIKINQKQHTASKKAHQELTAMQHLDEDIEQIFKNSEVSFSNKLYNLFANNNFSKINLKEKTHLIVNLIDNLAHEEVYHRHNNYNYSVMEDIVINAILNILKQ